jgi:hypothetical protein
LSTPFLQRFARHLIDRLLQAELIELGEAGAERAADDIAAHLARVRNTSLIGEIGRALEGSGAVAELYATDEELKEVVENLDPNITRG